MKTWGRNLRPLGCFNATATILDLISSCKPGFGQMAETLTAQEVRAKCVEAMPKQLGELYYELRNQLVLLHLKWNDYRSLYADGLETINLLNEAAPGFFYNLQRMMWEDVLLHLCRITDREQISGKETLTIQRLKREISDDEFGELRKKVEAQVKKACQKINSFARPLRNRRLAHRELPPSGGESPNSPG